MDDREADHDDDGVDADGGSACSVAI